MSQFISDIVDELTVECHICNQVFNTNEITLDDYHFGWDGNPNEDCCKECQGLLLKGNK